MTMKKPFSKIERVVTFKEVLKIQKNRCAVCNVKHGAYALKSTSGEYKELDDHDATFMKSTGVTLTKVYLKLIDNEINSDKQDLINYTALCPHHSQLALAEKIRKIKRNALVPNLQMTEREVIAIRTFVFNNFAYNATTRQTIQLVLLIEKLREDENKQ